MEMQQELDLDRLHTLLHGCAVGHTVDYRRSVESTMPPAHELAQDAAVRAGHIVTTEQQTSGKGRRGRSWDAPYAQGVLVSVVLTPPLLPGDPARIPMAAGLAVADTLLEAVPELAGTVSLKWPNDVLLGSGSSTGKVAGILVESAFESDALKYAVLGIGVNVNQRPAQFPEVAAHMVTPVSLRSFLGRRVDRTDLLAILCTQLAARFAADRVTRGHVSGMAVTPLHPGTACQRLRASASGPSDRDRYGAGRHRSRRPARGGFGRRPAHLHCRRRLRSGRDLIALVAHAKP